MTQRFTGIYALIDPPAHREPLAYLDALLRGGIRLVQIRAKAGIAPELFAAVVARIRDAGGTAIVNDDITLALGADGVHLGQEDAAEHDLRDVRARLGNRAIGLSCGTPAEARALPAGLVDYIGAGPIFATASKGDAGGPIGVNGVRVVVEATPLPVAAIGGITLASLPRVRETGAAMAAVISALATATRPEAAARAFIAAWGGR
jgi:thiamine-phosphate pyrophosphorylase